MALGADADADAAACLRCADDFLVHGFRTRDIPVCSIGAGSRLQLCSGVLSSRSRCLVWTASSLRLMVLPSTLVRPCVRACDSCSLVRGLRVLTCCFVCAVVPDAPRGHFYPPRNDPDAVGLNFPTVFIGSWFLDSTCSFLPGCLVSHQGGALSQSRPSRLTTSNWPLCSPCLSMLVRLRFHAGALADSSDACAQVRPT